MKKIELTIHNCTECPYYDKHFTHGKDYDTPGCLEIDREFTNDEILDTLLAKPPDDCPLEDM